LAAGLRHPGVVAVYDLDEHTRSLSLEYLPQGTLRERLNTVGNLEADELRATISRLLLTLAHVHERGLIHGDIKPRNVLLRAPGDPVLGDFGVARLRDGGDNASGGGTPLYFAP
jgi:eukaryotic-like serine/threonine-protein kinase